MTEAVVRRCFVVKVLLEISQNSQENTRAGVACLIKLQALDFFLQNTSGDCFCNEMPNSLRQVYDISLKSILNQDKLVELLDICLNQKNTPDAFVRPVQTGLDL